MVDILDGRVSLLTCLRIEDVCDGTEHLYSGQKNPIFSLIFHGARANKCPREVSLSLSGGHRQAHDIMRHIMVLSRLWARAAIDGRH